MTTAPDPHVPAVVEPAVVLDDRNHGVVAATRADFLRDWFAGTRLYLRSADVEHSVAIRDVLPAAFTIVRAVTGPYAVTVVARSEKASLLATVHVRSAHFDVLASSDAVADEVLAAVLLRAADGVEPPELTLSLVSHFDETDQVIAAEPWATSARNYPAGVRAELDRLIAVERPVAAGKLVLWHGPPGTGKTSAVRTLMREWAPWCAASYVTDPEILFSDPEYLLRVVTAPPDRESGPTLDRAGSTTHAWRLVVVEDSDEFLRSSARAQVGPALGRLLNVTDGILGQGVNAVILITTNEELARLHPALTRPGRCLSQISFDAFTPAEVVAWRGDDRPAPRRALTLAELYATDGTVDELERQPLHTAGAYL